MNKLIVALFVFISTKVNATTAQTIIDTNITSAPSNNKNNEIDPIKIGNLSLTPQKSKKARLLFKKIENTIRNDSLICKRGSQGQPWYFNAKPSVIDNDKYYLTILYKIEYLCGSAYPIFETRPFVINKKNFSLEKPQNFLPNELLEIMEINQKSNTIKIQSDNLIENFIAQSENKQCEYYLHTTSYTIWPQKDSIYFSPEFSKPDSECYRYYIKNKVDTEIINN